MTATASSSPVLPSIAVLGCGWLGLPLAKSLVQAGYPVVGSTTTPKQLLTLRDAGITPYLLQLGPDFSATDADTLRAMLTGTEVLVLNIPPSKAGPGGYPALLRPVGSAVAAAGVRHVLFVSSTSVYPDEPRPMTEADAVASAEASSDLLRAEGQFTSANGQWQTTVVRLSGLIGPDRPPGRFLAGRQNVPNGDAPVNLIHLDDCIGLLISIIQQNIWAIPSMPAPLSTSPAGSSMRPPPSSWAWPLRFLERIRAGQNHRQQPDPPHPAL
ncbi:NAD(P)H-binding protein [Hymenobacter cellulosilyticus]|uniref:NAD(P)H-binding protein n=1 Tax=Hymenobacter cellulosilyticus TaxID=2932248 RepID=A0A8T9Q1A5_9BACT|nr:NAD(P)H-binding protein [Hymenobacter cellulosilyticus]UOQ71177.1 NAD(P)H-binding protein [Hymenobacter cellulosilyticus]